MALLRPSLDYKTPCRPQCCGLVTDAHFMFPQDKAVLVALSLRDHMKVIELLYGMQCYSMAAMFVESCLQFNLLEENEKTCIL